jgi:hypothetical protein
MCAAETVEGDKGDTIVAAAAATSPPVAMPESSSDSAGRTENRAVNRSRQLGHAVVLSWLSDPLPPPIAPPLLRQPARTCSSLRGALQRGQAAGQSAHARLGHTERNSAAESATAKLYIGPAACACDEADEDASALARPAADAIAGEVGPCGDTMPSSGSMSTPAPTAVETMLGRRGTAGAPLAPATVVAPVLPTTIVAEP